MKNVCDPKQITRSFKLVLENDKLYKINKMTHVYARTRSFFLTGKQYLEAYFLKKFWCPFCPKIQLKTDTNKK